MDYTLGTSLGSSGPREARKESMGHNWLVYWPRCSYPPYLSGVCGTVATFWAMGPLCW